MGDILENCCTVQAMNEWGCWITISIDGVHEDYNKIRAPLKFDDMLRKLEAINEYKKKNFVV